MQACAAPVLEKLAAMELQRKTERDKKREAAKALQDPRENVQVCASVTEFAKFLFQY